MDLSRTGTVLNQSLRYVDPLSVQMIDICLVTTAFCHLDEKFFDLRVSLAEAIVVVKAFITVHVIKLTPQLPDTPVFGENDINEV